jgi:hypothetical protein
MKGPGVCGHRGGQPLRELITQSRHLTLTEQFFHLQSPDQCGWVFSCLMSAFGTKTTCRPTLMMSVPDGTTELADTTADFRK